MEALGSDHVNDHSHDQGDEERPPKRAKLLSKVCEACKHRKAKCDNVRPQCGHCRRKEVPCVYRAKGQPGLRPGFGKALEHRMEVLEDKVGHIADSLETLLQQRSRSTCRDGSHGPTPDAAQVETAESVESDGMDIVGLWQTPPPPSDPRNALMESGVSDAFAGSVGQSGLEILPSGLPSAEALVELADLYFSMVQPWCPLFVDHNAFKMSMFSERRKILLYGLVCASGRFWNGASEMQRGAYLDSAKERILLESIDKCTLISTQALALLAVDALGRGTGPHSWNTMSMLVTAARHLGIATNPLLVTQESSTPLVRNDDEEGHEQGPSGIEAEEKRRLFWVICTLDRFSSVAHGQPGGIDTRTIRMPYYSSDAGWTQTAVVRWFDGKLQWEAQRASDSPTIQHHYVDLLAFADRCNQLLIQPVNLFVPAQSQEWQHKFRALDADLTSWHASLPRIVHEQRQNYDVLGALLFASFQLIRIRMYTVAAFPSTTSPHVRASTSARLRCREAITEVCSLTRSLPADKFDQLGPQFAFALWVAARSLIIIWTTSLDIDTEQATVDMETLMSGLGHLAPRWPSASRYKSLVQLILDTKDGPEGPAELIVFNDTRRTAHGLEKVLGDVSRRRNAKVVSASLDFLDMSFLDNGASVDPTLPWMSNFGMDDADQWLR